MEIVNEKIEAYCEAHTTQESEVLYALNRHTHINVLRPRMLSGHFQGRLLSMISKIMQPKRILEIGTYTGYSAICLAEGLREDGKLITIDLNYELADLVNEFAEKAGFKNNIELLVGNAKEIIPSLDKSFDLVFIDADKDSYSFYYDLLIEDLPSGAVIIADNILWSGKVVEPVSPKDKDTISLMEFNKKIQDDVRVENVLLPIRDGLMVIRKK